jgi:hypothetical protein
MSELKTTLWELADEFRDLDQRILEAGDLTPEMEEEFDRLSGALGEKMLRCAEFRDTLLHNAAFTKERADALIARQRAWTNAAKRMQDYMLRQLQKANVGKLQAPNGERTWSVKATPGKVIVDDLSAIPETALRHFDPEPDLVAIRKLLKSGVPVAAHIEPGWTLDER